MERRGRGRGVRRIGRADGGEGNGGISVRDWGRRKGEGKRKGEGRKVKLKELIIRRRERKGRGVGKKGKRKRELG